MPLRACRPCLGSSATRLLESAAQTCSHLGCIDCNLCPVCSTHPQVPGADAQNLQRKAMRASNDSIVQSAIAKLKKCILSIYVNTGDASINILLNNYKIQRYLAVVYKRMQDLGSITDGTKMYHDIIIRIPVKLDSFRLKKKGLYCRALSHLLGHNFEAHMITVVEESSFSNVLMKPRKTIDVKFQARCSHVVSHRRLTQDLGVVVTCRLWKKIVAPNWPYERNTNEMMETILRKKVEATPGLSQIKLAAADLAPGNEVLMFQMEYIQVTVSGSTTYWVGELEDAKVRRTANEKYDQLDGLMRQCGILLRSPLTQNSNADLYESMQNVNLKNIQWSDYLRTEKPGDSDSSLRKYKVVLNNPSPYTDIRNESNLFQKWKELFNKNKTPSTSGRGSIQQPFYIPSDDQKKSNMEFSVQMIRAVNLAITFTNIYCNKISDEVSPCIYVDHKSIPVNSTRVHVYEPVGAHNPAAAGPLLAPPPLAVPISAPPAPAIPISAPPAPAVPISAPPVPTVPMIPLGNQSGLGGQFSPNIIAHSLNGLLPRRGG